MASRLPRGVRVPALLLAAALVVSAFGWGLFLHNPAPSEPQRPSFLAPPGEPLPAPAENQSYELTVRMESQDAVSGEVVVRKKRYVPGANPVVKDSLVASSGDVVQQVTYRNGSMRYTRRTYGDASALQRRVDTSDAARIERSSLTAYSADADRSSAADIEPREALQRLYVFRYEFRGTTTYQGRTVKRYVPVTGWNVRVMPGGSERSLYVREASGEVLVDAEDGAILKADIEGAAIRADSWSDVMTGEARTIDLRYEVTTGVENVSQPPWVNGLKNVSAST